jgi:hypothetical protein
VEMPHDGSAVSCGSAARGGRAIVGTVGSGGSAAPAGCASRLGRAVPQPVSEGIGGPALGESPYLPDRERIERTALRRVRVGRRAGRGGALGNGVRAERDLPRDDDLAVRVAERKVDEIFEAVPAGEDGAGQLPTFGAPGRADDLRDCNRVGVTGPLHVQPEGGPIGRDPYTGVDEDGLILDLGDGDSLLDRDQAEVRPRSLPLRTSRRGGGRYPERGRQCGHGQKRDRGAHGSRDRARHHWRFFLLDGKLSDAPGEWSP